MAGRRRMSERTSRPRDGQPRSPPREDRSRSPPREDQSSPPVRIAGGCQRGLRRQPSRAAARGERAPTTAESWNATSVSALRLQDPHDEVFSRELSSENAHEPVADEDYETWQRCLNAGQGGYTSPPNSGGAAGGNEAQCFQSPEDARRQEQELQERQWYQEQDEVRYRALLNKRNATFSHALATPSAAQDAAEDPPQTCLLCDDSKGLQMSCDEKHRICETCAGQLKPIRCPWCRKGFSLSEPQAAAAAPADAAVVPAAASGAAMPHGIATCASCKVHRVDCIMWGRNRESCNHAICTDCIRALPNRHCPFCDLWIQGTTGLRFPLAAAVSAAAGPNDADPAVAAMPHGIATCQRCKVNVVDRMIWLCNHVICKHCVANLPRICPVCGEAFRQVISVRFHGHHGGARS